MCCDSHAVLPLDYGWLKGWDHMIAYTTLIDLHIPFFSLIIFQKPHEKEFYLGLVPKSYSQSHCDLSFNLIMTITI